ncbi:MAG TPA: hypothetical protein VLX92_00390 [Kofleriaceae bacterium]|nr:hypothetical protein [Kofleriaceae bacterium]
MSARWLVLAALAGCTGVQQRFPDDLQSALAHQAMRELETDRFIIYYPANRRAEVDRFLARADRCAEILRGQAIVRDGAWDEKMVILMPDVAFNNAFVLPELAGYEEVSVIPLHATLDFTTEFGIPPDPGYIACHELVHYVHEQQIADFWQRADQVFGHIYTPQLGYDPWFFEGLATHYEAKLSPGVGRPTWPIFTGMFAAGYAGHRVGSGSLSSLDRISDVGNHYLVGTMFVRFLTETYGDKAMWLAIAAQAHALTGLFNASTFERGFGVSFGTLIDRFDAWVHRTFPERARPAGQRRLAVLGNQARYARGRDGTEAWVADDVDAPARLIVRDRGGAVLAELPLVEVVPRRTLVQGDPLLVSGLSITADGNEVWLTVIDLGATFQIPRLVRWRRGERGLTAVTDRLGPGGTIDPAGRIYYYAYVDGDRWCLAAWDVHARGAPRMVLDMAPGTYVLAAQISPDGAQLAADVWDGHAFVVWVVDARSGAIVRRLGGDPARPLWDASFTSDGRLMWLGEVDARFQVFVDGAQATDAPYAALDAREAGGTIRFMDREGWTWELAEVALPDRAPVALPVADLPRDVAPVAVHVRSDRPFSPLDHLFYPQERAPTVVASSSELPLFGLVIGGGDRLGLQRWSIAGLVQPAVEKVPRTHWGADLAYLNAMLAPVLIVGEFSLLDWSDQTDNGSGTNVDEERRTRDATLAATYTYRGTLTSSLGGVYSDDFDRVTGLAGAREHVGGPQLAVRWDSAETTRYTGPRRALVADAAVAFYPRQVSTFSDDITDLGGSLGVVVPLPLGRRHTLSASVRGRALVAPHDTGLLQLGGDTGLYELYNGSSGATPPSFDSSRFPPNLRFVEPLRGYEDYAITTDRAEIANLAWRYPLIVDKGVAITAGFLPATFVQELDVELFGAGALDQAGDRHAAAGGALTLKLELLRVPLVITYQIARRLYDDRAFTQLVGVAPQ